MSLIQEIESVEHWPLVGPDDPDPFTVLNASGQAPFLIVADHASRAIPDQMKQLGLADWVLERHVACDIGSAELATILAKRFDAPAVLAGYSRLIVDLNRQLYDESAFIKISDGIAIPGNLEISSVEKSQRIESFFNPYHDTIARMIGQFRDRGQVPAVISIHTCTPVFNQVVRQWHIGVMWDKDPRIARPLLGHLEAVDGICVGDNEPYSGAHPNDYTIDVHAEQQGLPCVGVEVRQDLVGTSQGAQKWGGILGDALEKSLADSSIFQLNPNHIDVEV